MSGVDIFGFMDMLINLFDGAIVVLGGLLTAMGVAGLGFGCWDVYNHFKPENRDSGGDQKSRFTSGLVKFGIGGLLATSGYQVIATNTFQDGATSNTISVTHHYEAAPADSYSLNSTNVEIITVA